MGKVLAFIFFNILIGILQASRIPVVIPSHEEVEERMEFDVLLPNKDVIQVDLFVRLMKGDSKNSTQEPSEEPSTTTTTETTPLNDDPNLVTVKDAIEAFRRELIQKESNIGGIIESTHPFYRHFQLEHGPSIVRIRCTYDSDFEKKMLSIKCFEYKTVSEQRLLSNGDLETIHSEKELEGSDLEFIDIAKYKQTFHMNIY